MKKLFTAPQIKAWDAYTIKHTPIESIDLMEHASIAFVNWFHNNYSKKTPVYIVCGPGNNGGDGFAICRLLLLKGFQATPYLINPNKRLSENCEANLKRIPIVKDWKLLNTTVIQKNDIIIDAVLGTGLSRVVTGEHAELIDLLNAIDCHKIAVDVPSGMNCDQVNEIDDVIFKADEVLCFQSPKRAFYFVENTIHLKSFTIADIGLHAIYYKQTHCNWMLINKTDEIPGFNSNNLLIYDRKLFEEEYQKPFTTDIALALLTQKGIQQQKIVQLNAHANYYLTPKGNIYIILI